MSVINGYGTLAEFKLWQNISATNTNRDIVINNILTAVSRDFDRKTAHTFYPRVETHYYDLPEGRSLEVDDDLLEIISVTNGDDATIASTEYILIPGNKYPKRAIKIKADSTEIWEVDGDGNTEQVIDIAAYWGYHDKYSTRAWTTGSTVNESAEYSSSDTTLTVASGTLFDPGQIIKIDSELIRVTAVSSEDLTVVRGENGSTAAAHDDGSTVYIWEPMENVKEAVLSIATSVYKRRFGENQSSDTIITAGGIVITPRDMPGMAADTIRGLKRWL